MGKVFELEGRSTGTCLVMKQSFDKLFVDKAIRFLEPDNEG